jgi:hypothetical protein
MNKPQFPIEFPDEAMTGIDVQVTNIFSDFKGLTECRIQNSDFKLKQILLCILNWIYFITHVPIEFWIIKF